MNSNIACGILVTLINEKKCSSKFLAEKFEVSTKTVYRYVEALSASGIPLFCSQGKNGGIEIDPNFELESNFLTTSEISKIACLLSSSEISRIDPITKNVIDKINHLLNNKASKLGVKQEDQIIVDNLPWGVQALHTKETLKLLDACNKNQILTINYISTDNVASKRTVFPYCLVLKDGVWYLYAYCTSRNDYRLFRCSRITSVIISNKTFERKATDLVSKPWLSSPILNIKETIELEVPSNLIFELKDWLPDLKIIKQNENIAKICATAYINKGLISKIISYFGEIKILSPNNLAESVKKAGKSIANAYLY